MPRTKKIIASHSENKISGDVNMNFENYFGDTSPEKVTELYNLISLPKFKRYILELRHSLTNWWHTEKAIVFVKDERNMINFTDYVWILVVSQLRNFTLPPKLIAKYREQLFEPITFDELIQDPKTTIKLINKLEIPNKDKSMLLSLINDRERFVKSSITIFHTLILEIIIKRKNLSIAFFADSTYMILDETRSEKYTPSELKKLEQESYVRVSVTNIISKFFRSEIAFKAIGDFPVLSEAENKLYTAIQSGDYDSIHITFKDKKIKALELKKSADVKNKIIDILNEGEFAEISVKKHKGIITKVEHTLKLAF